MLISYLCFSNQYGKAGMLSSLPNATSKSFSICTSALQKCMGWLQRHVSILLVFTKFKFPMKNAVKHNSIVFNTPGLLPLPFLLRLMQLHLLQKSCATLEPLLFLVTVKLPSYASPASAKDLFLVKFWRYI